MSILFISLLQLWQVLKGVAGLKPTISLSTLTHNPPHFSFAVVADIEGVGGVL